MSELTLIEKSDDFVGFEFRLITYTDLSREVDGLVADMKRNFATMPDMFTFTFDTALIRQKFVTQTRMLREKLLLMMMYIVDHYNRVIRPQLFKVGSASEAHITYNGGTAHWDALTEKWRKYKRKKYDARFHKQVFGRMKSSFGVELLKSRQVIGVKIGFTGEKMMKILANEYGDPARGFEGRPILVPLAESLHYGLQQELIPLLTRSTKLGRTLNDTLDEIIARQPWVNWWSMS